MPDRAQPTQPGDPVTEAFELTLEDLCTACDLPREQIEIYVAEGIIEPQGSRITQWRFSRMNIIHVSRARRLQRDLGLNVAGVALAFDLMTRIETLKRRLARFEQATEDTISGN